MKIYLSGSITGSAEDAIVGWRRKVLELLPRTVEVFDPTALPFDSIAGYLQQENPTEALQRLRHGMLVVDRNKHLIRSSDVVLANFLHADHASIGSIGELFWANAFRVPIVIVREQTGNVHDHAMLNAIASIVTSTLEDGCKAALNMFHAETRLGRRNVSRTTPSQVRTSHRS
ncbi:hypothetical protein [Mesorhizobium humile]|uniref:Nucleoside 2-deoxyribosyltransferase n=1 Tax=Mesorhizobium humile TaxID=3072313 RepID=A0ABU4YJA9_9HYPH|nr:MULTISPECIES: hypothetical protein [unclassified Mesorhizobium]MDX8457244.1 hypothetical protein [Mesorhizobium sp. VK2D]MDX8487037.1 hypothetical protein [Mesorhizobium sp. VK2B]